MSGIGIGYGGALGQILEVLPLDSTGHVMDCGYDDNDRRCGCYDLPSKIAKIIATTKATTWDEGFTRGFYDPLAGGSSDASESTAVNPYEATS